MATEKFLTYRGDIKAGVGVGGTVAFVTVHPEGQPTAVYRLDADKLTLTSDALPSGGVAIAADEKTLYVAGTDRRVYELAGKKAPRQLGQPFESPVVAVLPVSKKRLAVLNGKR